MRRFGRPLLAAALAGVALAGAYPATAAVSTGGPGTWIGHFQLTREAWLGGATVQLFIAFAPPTPEQIGACSGPPGGDAVYLIAPVDADAPQGTGGRFPTGPDSVFDEPAHDDVLPAGVGTSPARATASCGYFLLPADQPGRVRTRVSSDVAAGSPLKEVAYAVDLDSSSRFVPLNDHATAVAALDAGLVRAQPIGYGGVAWRASCDVTASPRRPVVRASGAGQVLCGSSGRDVLIGGRGDDLLIGFDGNDLLIGGGGTDIAIGGRGDDVVSMGRSHGEAYGGTGNSPLGEDGHNVMTGSAATLTGGLDRDLLASSAGVLIGHPDAPFAYVPFPPATDLCLAGPRAVARNCTG